MKIENIKNFGIHRRPETNYTSEWVITEDGRLFMRDYFLGNTNEDRQKNSKQAKWRQVHIEIEDEKEKGLKDGGPGINIKRPAR